MCQLFGFSCNGVNGDFSDLFIEFRSRGRYNPHAWGAALWVDTTHGPLVVRDPHPANTSRAAALIASLEARTLIAHVRYGTVKPLDSVVNAHPFVANINGKDWAFAHNGFLRGVEKEAELAMVYIPNGTTDSEQFFSVLADRLHAEKSHAVAVASTARKYARAGKLNFILSNGEEFYFFSNHEGLHYKATKSAVYVATAPVGMRDEWYPTKPGTLYVAERGRIMARVMVENRATYIPKKKDVTDTTGAVVQQSLAFGNSGNSSSGKIAKTVVHPDLTEDEWKNLRNFIEERKGADGKKVTAAAINGTSGTEANRVGISLPF